MRNVAADDKMQELSEDLSQLVNSVETEVLRLRAEVRSRVLDLQVKIGKARKDLDATGEETT